MATVGPKIQIRKSASFNALPKTPYTESTVSKLVDLDLCSTEKSFHQEGEGEAETVIPCLPSLIWYRMPVEGFEEKVLSDGKKSPD
jgi:hypothetical protein